MTTTPNTAHSWEYEYLPYTMSGSEDSAAEIEIPNYRIFSPNDPEHYIAETNEQLPGDVQEKHARLLSTAPEMFNALEYFFNIMHDYESSLRKGYVQQAIDTARKALEKATGGAI